MLSSLLWTTGVFNEDGVAALDPDLLATGEIHYQHLTCQKGDSWIKQESHIKTFRNTTAKKPIGLNGHQNIEDCTHTSYQKGSYSHINRSII